MRVRHADLEAEEFESPQPAIPQFDDVAQATAITEMMSRHGHRLCAFDLHLFSWFFP
jgi:hypothetical protein